MSCHVLQEHQNSQVYLPVIYLGIWKEKTHDIFPRIYSVTFIKIIDMNHLGKYSNLFVCSVHVKFYTLFNMLL